MNNRLLKVNTTQEIFFREPGRQGFGSDGFSLLWSHCGQALPPRLLSALPPKSDGRRVLSLCRFISTTPLRHPSKHITLPRGAAIAWRADFGAWRGFYKE